MIRIVNGAGGGAGGNMDPTVMDVVVAHTHAVSYSLNDPGHSHEYLKYQYLEPQTGHSTNCWFDTKIAQTSTSITGVTVDVSVGGIDTVNGSPSGGSSWVPRYADCIICYKN